MRDGGCWTWRTIVGVLAGLGCLAGGPTGAAAAGGEADFVGLTPCRLADTRGNGFGGPFGPPALPAGVPRDFPLQGQCGIPATALAVSLNVTATNTQGAGFFLLSPQGGALPLVSTLNYVAGETVANAAIVPLGAGGLTVVAGVSGADLVLDVDGYFTDSLVHAVESLNLFVGEGAGNLATTGQSNTAVGAGALRSNTDADDNTAVGLDALLSNTTGDWNTAVGLNALRGNISGSNGTAIGRRALVSNTTGNLNTALGAEALRDNTTGSGNVALGYQAGRDATTGSNNIYIAHTGFPGEASTTRIGSAQSRTFIAGIRGAMTEDPPALQVLVDTRGQLGVVASSARVKEAIEPMGEASRGLLRLRPVTFRYWRAAANGTKPRQYGLIAEEVAEVFPELVAYGADGQPETVLYHVLPALLLNELQRQQGELAAQAAALAAKTETLEAQGRVLKGLRRRLEALEAGAAAQR